MYQPSAPCAAPNRKIPPSRSECCRRKSHGLQMPAPARRDKSLSAAAPKPHQAAAEIRLPANTSDNAGLVQRQRVLDVAETGRGEAAALLHVDRMQLALD